MIKSNQVHSVVEVNMKVQGRIRIERIGLIQHSQWSGDISAERVFDFQEQCSNSTRKAVALPQV